MTAANTAINLHAPGQEALLRALLALLPASLVLTDPEDLRPFRWTIGIPASAAGRGFAGNHRTGSSHNALVS